MTSAVPTAAKMTRAAMSRTRRTIGRVGDTRVIGPLLAENRMIVFRTLGAAFSLRTASSARAAPSAIALLSCRCEGEIYGHRSHHAADGRVDRRGNDHQMDEEGRRHGQT